MTRRRRLRRRLLWGGVLFGLVLLLTTVSLLRVGIWARGHLTATARRIQFVPLIRKENTMVTRTSFVVVAAIAALLLAAPASADRWSSDRRDEATASAPDWFERFVAAHSIREPVVDDRFAIDPTDAPAPAKVSSSREIEWPQIGIGLGLGTALALALLVALRRPNFGPPVAR